MRSIWQSLAWKEWHEHKWKLAALVATLAGVALIIFAFTWPDVRFDVLGLRIVLVITIVPLAIFIGLGAAAGERSHRTLPFLQALPISMRRVAVHKMFFGLITVIAPGIALLGSIYVWCKLAGVDYSAAVHKSMDYFPNPFSFGASDRFVDTALAVMFVASSFYIWAAATGVNRKDEISAGAIVLVLTLTWTVLVSYSVHWLMQRSDWNRTAACLSATILLSTAPGGLVTTIEMATEYKQNFFAVGLWTAVITHLVLASVYIQRFGRVENLEIRSPQIAKRNDGNLEWLGLPRRSRFSAIAWKQLRESGPIVLVGLAGIIGIVAVVTISYWWESASPRIGEVYVPVSAALGFVMALVIGIGICFYDVSPQINLFWRSRPIDPDSWFWCKYATGLAVLLAAIYAPIFLLAALGDRSGFWDEFWHSDRHEALMLPLVHVAVFAAAVAMMCLVRHAVYAAILSITFVYLGVLVGFGMWFVMGILGWVQYHPIWRETEMQVVAGLITSFCISTLLAWLAMRYDWGRKSRY